jgi:hypothetical protein
MRINGVEVHAARLTVQAKLLEAINITTAVE